MLWVTYEDLSYAISVFVFDSEHIPLSLRAHGILIHRSIPHLPDQTQQADKHDCRNCSAILPDLSCRLFEGRHPVCVCQSSVVEDLLHRTNTDDPDRRSFLMVCSDVFDDPLAKQLVPFRNDQPSHRREEGGLGL